MSGEADLAKLLASMSPTLEQDEYVFLSFESAQYGDYAELEPTALIRESEGLTFVVPKPMADQHAFGYEAVFRKISLRVHSSLEAVGLTAAFATQLSDEGISANVVAGYFHDHIFVPRQDAERAITALNQLT